MDATTIAVVATVITAFLAIIPNVLGVINQRKVDEAKAKAEDKRADLEANTAATTATTNVIATLQNELARVQADNVKYHDRIIELEDQAIVKTQTIGKLMQESIAAQTEVLEMKYKMQKLQMKLDSVLPEKIAEQGSPKRRKEETVPKEMVLELKKLEQKAVLIQEETDRQVEEIKSKSISNGGALTSFTPE